MNLKRAILFALALLLLPSIVYGIGIKKFVTATSAVEKFCDTSAATGAGLCHDFEIERVLHTPDGDCEKSRAYGSINPLGEIGYVVNSPDCDNTTNPIDGTYDLKLSNEGNTDIFSYYPLDGGGTTPVCASNETCVITALINIPADSGQGPATGKLIAFMEDTGFSTLCGAYYDGANNDLRTHCDGDHEDMTYVLTNGTTYKICVKYSQVDDCEVYLDPETGTWCVGEHDSGSGLNCNAGVHDAVDYIDFADAGDNADVQYDNIIVVAE